MSNEPKMTTPIDYLAFVEWPCKPTRWNDGGSDFECAGCIVTVQTTPTRLEHAAHLKGCRIAQRNAALQAAHAMQARVEQLERELGSIGHAWEEADTRRNERLADFVDILQGAGFSLDGKVFMADTLRRILREPDAPAAIPEKDE